MNHPLHLLLLDLVKRFEETEFQIIECLIEARKERLYSTWGYKSLFQYCREGLGLSEDRAWTFCKLAGKCVEVPALKAALDQGDVDTSNARQLLKILEPSNADYWLPLARDLSQRALRKEIVAKHPERAVVESIKPISSTCSEFRAAITPETEKVLNRSREVLSQKLKKPLSWEDVLKALATGFLEKHDPVIKAERVLQKNPVSIRVNTPAKLPSGRTCQSRHWVERHHIKPLSQGGKHELDNLTLLCSNHHGSLHGRHKLP